MRKHSLLYALTLAFFLFGCKVGPNYQRPAVATPAEFRNPMPPAPPADSLANLKWFEIFQDEALQSLIREATEHNFDLRLAVTRVDAARGNLGLTRSNQYPNFDGTVDFASTRISRAGAFPLPEGVEQNRNFGTVGAALLTFEVDLWGRLRRATEAARADLLQAEETRNAVLTTLVADVAANYFALRALDAELAIARRTLETRQASLRLIEVRQKGGVATLLDVRQAEQLVYSAAQAIPETTRLIEQTENRLNLLLGKSPGTINRGAALTEQIIPPAVPSGLPAELLERRPDIRAAEQALVAANARIGVAKAAYFPRLALTGTSGYQSNQLSELFSRSTGIWQFLPNLSQPVFTAGRIRSNIAISEANQRASLVLYESSIQTAFREVSDALIQLQRVREVRDQKVLLVNTLRDRSRLAYLRYRGGVDTLLNALDADRDLFNSELSLVATQRDELVAIVELYKALGGGWQG